MVETKKFESIHKGDMIGDTPLIGEHHIKMADTVFPLVEMAAQGKAKVVIAVGGPSGSGKSETAALLADRLAATGKKVYVLSCDNYPHLPPRTNEKKREEIFAATQAEGLKEYLGTQNEIDFRRLSTLVSDFKSGKSQLSLRIMDNPANKLHDDNRILDASKLDAIVLEGTWSSLIENTDLRVFLYSTPEETRAHRIARGRDPEQDSPVTKTVLGIEQGKLEDIARNVAEVMITRQYQITKRGKALELKSKSGLTVESTSVTAQAGTEAAHLSGKTESPRGTKAAAV